MIFCIRDGNIYLYLLLARAMFIIRIEDVPLLITGGIVNLMATKRAKFVWIILEVAKSYHVR